MSAFRQGTALAVLSEQRDQGVRSGSSGNGFSRAVKRGNKATLAAEGMSVPGRQQTASGNHLQGQLAESLLPIVIPSAARDLLFMDERLYYVYILASRSRVLYTGVTNDLLRRVQEHREGLAPGFTTQYRIHRLVHFEMSRDVRVAIAREKEIKGWSRSKKVALIEENNPTWADLADRSFGRYPRKADPSLRSG